MLKQERHQYILKKVEEEGRVLTNDLQKELQVSFDTVRKDFQELAAEGKVKRIHGGILKKYNETMDFETRKEHRPSVKRQLSGMALPLVMQHHVLYLDSGTTNLKLAEELSKAYTGTIITNSPEIALQLCNCPNVEIVMLGGRLEKTIKVIVGTNAIRQMDDFNIECCVLGVGALSPEHGITFPVYEETLLKQVVLGKSKTVVAIATKEKLGTISGFYCADIQEIDYLVTDETDEKRLAAYRQKGIEIISADLTQEEEEPNI